MSTLSGFRAVTIFPPVLNTRSEGELVAQIFLGKLTHFWKVHLMNLPPGSGSFSLSTFGVDKKDCSSFSRWALPLLLLKKLLQFSKNYPVTFLLSLLVVFQGLDFVVWRERELEDLSQVSAKTSAHSQLWRIIVLSVNC